MHHIYHTEGIILGSRNFGEAGKVYSIFTRDLGMITASATGVRKMSSKLRFILQNFSYVKIDLVRGKDFWRLTSGTKTAELQNICKRAGALAIILNISRLLKRLLPGEDANPALFTDLIKGFSILEKLNTEEELRNIEMVVVLRILHNLGYIGKNKMLDELVESPLESSLIFEVTKKRIAILSLINQTLKETHL